MANQRAKSDSPDEDDYVLWQRVTALVKPAVQQNRRYSGADLNQQGHNQGHNAGHDLGGVAASASMAAAERHQADGVSVSERHQTGGAKAASASMAAAARHQADGVSASASMAGFESAKASAETLAKTSAETPAKTSPVDLRAGEKAGIDGGTQKRLFRGDVKIDARLDLHGYNAAHAHQKLTQFLSQGRSSGYRCILVITGKGARGAGVLRNAVPDWLKQSPLSDLVLAIAQAKPSDGGAGALYVLLRRQRERK